MPDSTDGDVDKAVEAAARAFPSWSKIAPSKRAQYMRRIADLIEEKLDEFASAESNDQGKPMQLARQVDIPRAVWNFRYFADVITSGVLNKGEAREMENGVMFSYTSRTPIGVAGLISPWNLYFY